MMKRVSSAEMAKQFSMYCDFALSAPLVITKNGRDRLVVLSIDEYNFLQDLVQKADPVRAAAQAKVRAASDRSG